MNKIIKIIPPNDQVFHFLNLAIDPHEDYIVVEQDAPGEDPRIACRAQSRADAERLYREQQ